MTLFRTPSTKKHIATLLLFVVLLPALVGGGVFGGAREVGADTAAEVEAAQKEYQGPYEKYRNMERPFFPTDEQRAEQNSIIAEYSAAKKKLDDAKKKQAIENEALNPPNPCSGWDFGCNVPFILFAVVNAIFALVQNIFLVIFGFVIWIVTYNDFLNSPVVEVGWVLVRDVANLFFILILLVIAFSTILGVEKLSYKQHLFKLLLMAVVINFSKMITGLMIDFSQVVMMTFANALTNLGTFSANVGLGKSQTFEKGAGIGNFFGLLLNSIFGIILLLFACVVVGIIFVMLLARILMLWILTALSPLPFLLSAFPQGQQYAGKWWGELSKNLVGGPVLVFFLWLALAVQAKIQSAFIGAGDITITVGPSKMGTSDSLVTFAVTMGLLIAGLKFAQESGAAGGSLAGSALSKGKDMMKGGVDLFIARGGIGKTLSLGRRAGMGVFKGENWKALGRGAKALATTKEPWKKGWGKTGGAVVGGVKGGASLLRTLSSKKRLEDKLKQYDADWDEKKKKKNAEWDKKTADKNADLNEKIRTASTPEIKARLEKLRDDGNKRMQKEREEENKKMDEEHKKEKETLPERFKEEDKKEQAKKWTERDEKMQKWSSFLSPEVIKEATGGWMKREKRKVYPEAAGDLEDALGMYGNRVLLRPGEKTFEGEGARESALEERMKELDRSIKSPEDLANRLIEAIRTGNTLDIQALDRKAALDNNGDDITRVMHNMKEPQKAELQGVLKAKGVEGLMGTEDGEYDQTIAEAFRHDMLVATLGEDKAKQHEATVQKNMEIKRVSRAGLGAVTTSEDGVMHNNATEFQGQGDLGLGVKDQKAFLQGKVEKLLAMGLKKDADALAKSIESFKGLDKGARLDVRNNKAHYFIAAEQQKNEMMYKMTRGNTSGWIENRGPADVNIQNVAKYTDEEKARGLHLDENGNPKPKYDRYHALGIAVEEELPQSYAQVKAMQRTPMQGRYSNTAGISSVDKYSQEEADIAGMEKGMPKVDWGKFFQAYVVNAEDAMATLARSIDKPDKTAVFMKRAKKEAADRGISFEPKPLQTVSTVTNEDDDEEESATTSTTTPRTQESGSQNSDAKQRSAQQKLQDKKNRVKQRRDNKRKNKR